MLDKTVNASSGGQIRGVRKKNPAGVTVTQVKTVNC
jgi:hypothetical protein